ncbi:MAG: TIGR03915 family putative DNA repair protein [Clostridia bacterium]|nr:TIGR03915 family putative DNA repair protein [Clostridia bacterium]
MSAGVCYRYDGSLDGLLCCVFEAYRRKEEPLSIVAGGAVQLALDARVRDIASDPERASRVQQGILRHIGPEAFARVQQAALSADPSAARVALAYVRLGFAVGPRIDQRLADPAVHAMNKLLRQVGWEAHRYIQFLRFAELEGGVYFAEMEPEHDVLVLVMPHFADRFGQQPFIIHDRTRRLAGVWDMRGWTLLSSETMNLPPFTADEARYQALWRTFYNSIAIKQRVNPNLRRQFMPKKFWRYITEMQPELPGKEADGALLPAGKYGII